MLSHNSRLLKNQNPAVKVKIKNTLLIFLIKDGSSLCSRLYHIGKIPTYFEITLRFTFMKRLKQEKYGTKKLDFNNCKSESLCAGTYNLPRACVCPFISFTLKRLVTFNRNLL